MDERRVNTESKEKVGLHQDELGTMKFNNSCMSSVNAHAEPGGSSAQTGGARRLPVQEAHGKSHISSEAAQQVMNHNNTQQQHYALQHMLCLK